MSAATKTYRYLRTILIALIEPLKADDEITHFTLSIPDAQTTTVDSVQGWSNRPPALLRCPGCAAQIPQRQSSARIDCPDCYREFGFDEFSDLELLGMVCPRCNTEMDHGIRHPKMFDIPEWATCPDCQYHWDLDHWFRRRKRR
jgi:Zn finger protein HypA/HybF involved in hydrogenase expression